MDDLEESGAQTFDAAHLKQVMGHFATGVAIITAMDGNDPVGFAVQTFQSLSVDPPLVLFSAQLTSTTWPRIQKAGTFCVNILADHQEAMCRTFGASGADKFRGVGWVPAPRTGAPLLRDVLAWVEGRIIAEHEGGDHVVVVGRVLDLHVEHEGRPLLFYRGGFGRFEV